MYDNEKSPFMVFGGDDEKKTSPWLTGLLVLFVLAVIVYAGSMLFTSSGTWQSSEWGACSKVCGGGTQARTVSCVNGECDIATKPLDSQACGTEPCWSQTALVGGLNGNAYDYKCPDGQYVNKVYYRAGAGLDQIGVRCNNSTLNAATSNLYGGYGGSPGSFDVGNGIDSFYVTGNEYVGNITPGTEAAANTTQGGAADGPWAGSTTKLSCPPGSKIAGIYGKSDEFNNSLGFNCYKFE